MEHGPWSGWQVDSRTVDHRISGRTGRTGTSMLSWMAGHWGAGPDGHGVDIRWRAHCIVGHHTEGNGVIWTRSKSRRIWRRE